MDGTAIVAEGPATTCFKELCESMKWGLLLAQGDLAPGKYIFEVDPRDPELMRTAVRISSGSRGSTSNMYLPGARSPCASSKPHFMLSHSSLKQVVAGPSATIAVPSIDHLNLRN